MHKRRIVVFAAVVSVAACSDATLTSPDDDGIRAGPSLAIVDAGNGGEVDGFWFLPPLAKQVTTEGFLDEGLQPAMRVCELTGNPSAIAPGGDPSVVCVDQDGDPATDDPKIVTYFPPGSAGTAPGSHYEFSWDTDASPANLQPMDAERFYRIQILLEDVLLGYLDVNPQEPSGQLPGEDYADLYAFRLGETLPVKVFLTTQVRCALAAQEEYVVQCTAQGVVDDDGGVVTLEPIPDWPATISVVVPAEALPPGYPTVILTLERIDPVAFEATTGEACIPGLPGLSSFDAPLFGDCLRVTSDPVLPMELEAAALIEICVDLSSPSFSTVKLTEGQEDRLQIIRYADDGTTHGLPNVQTTTCPAPAQPSPAQLGFFPVP
ncbi:MAG TPA: hypothetical protein VLA09_04645, partial [Longimicrobiales bacterium]|nr:hypothetical protein [Longimicrobiales bacterium]